MVCSLAGSNMFLAEIELHYFLCSPPSNPSLRPHHPHPQDGSLFSFYYYYYIRVCVYIDMRKSVLLFVCVWFQANQTALDNQ